MLQSGLTCAQRARAHSVNEIHFLKHQNAQFCDICDGHWIHLMDFGGCIMPNTSSLSRPQMIWFDFSSLIHIIGVLMHNAHSNDLTVIPKNGSIQFCDRLRLPFRNDWRKLAFWDYGSAAHPISTTRALILITWVELLDESKVHDSTADEHYVILMHHCNRAWPHSSALSRGVRAFYACAGPQSEHEYVPRRGIVQQNRQQFGTMAAQCTMKRIDLSKCAASNGSAGRGENAAMPRREV